MNEKLHAALVELEREGALSPEQRVVVERRLDAALARRRDAAGLVVSALGGLGALLVGAGLLYAVGYNWDALARGEKLALLFAVWTGVHAAGWWLAEARGNYPRLGRALTLLGVLGCGGALALVAQVYQLDAEYPWAVCLWWVLHVPLLFLTRSRALQWLLTALFVLWIFWHVCHWASARERWSSDVEIAAPLVLCAGLGALFTGLAQAVERTAWAHFARLWHALAPLAAWSSAYLLAFQGLADDVSARAPWVMLLPAALSAALGLAGTSLALARGAARHVWTEQLAFSVNALLLGLCAWRTPDALPIVANGIALAGSVGLLAAGARWGRVGWIHFGLASAALLVVTRYVEYLWHKLEGAYAFLLGGALLLALGWFLERRRRSLVARAKEHGA